MLDLILVGKGRAKHRPLRDPNCIIKVARSPNQHLHCGKVENQLNKMKKDCWKAQFKGFLSIQGNCRIMAPLSLTQDTALLTFQHVR